MSLNAHSVALRGVGYGALAMALSGYIPLGGPTPPPVTTFQHGGHGWLESDARAEQVRIRRLQMLEEDALIMATLAAYLNRRNR